MTTLRLLIRDPLISDLKIIHQLLMLPETVEYNPSGYPESELATGALLERWVSQISLEKRTCYFYVIETLKDGAFVGIISLERGKEGYLNAEIWFKLHTHSWNKGYATEALKAMIHFGFKDLGLHRIEAGCSTLNIASSRVMENAGMTKEGVKRKNLPLKGGWHDSFQFAVLSK